MIALVQQVRLPASPERVWEWFRELDERYPEWHPEHLQWRTLRGEPLTEGAVVFADEWLGPLRLSGRFFIREVDPGRSFAYRLAFPASLVQAGGSFDLAPVRGEGCIMTQRVHLGWSLPLVGALLDAVLSLALPLGELRRHMREEQANLVRLLEVEEARP